ncbi:MAG: hypothetical protein JXA30_04975 [Deltaproteobacteria bacterium]|nr:hypothetical protein [Deltaproteobacteria bacterium]
MKPRNGWIVNAMGLLLATATVGCGDDDTETASAADTGLDALIVDSGLDVSPAVVGDDTGTSSAVDAGRDAVTLDSGQDALSDGSSVPVDARDGDTEPAEPRDAELPPEDATTVDSSQDAQVAQPVKVVGRIWNYTASYPPLQFEYDYPWDAVTINAYGIGNTSVANTVIDTDSCTPWNPGDPYMCGTFDLNLDQNKMVMLKATDNTGYKNTLTRIFPVEPGSVQIIVMVQDSIVSVLTEAWKVSVDSGKGYVAGIVAVKSGDLHAAPYEQFIGNASVEITPSNGFGDDFMLAYYDSSDPMNTSRTGTDPNNPIFGAINLPPRDFDDPYEMTITHSSFNFQPVRFTVQPDVLTFLVISPEQ